MNIFWHELKANRKSTIIWTLSLIAIVVLYMSIFPSFAKDSESFIKMFQGYPEPVRRALGVNLDLFFSVLGFYCFPLTFATLCAAIQAMNLGTSIVSKEVREKTADFLLTKPVKRSTVLTSKVLASMASLVMTNVFFVAAAFVMVNSVKTDDFEVKTFFLLSLTVLFLQLIFLALGVVVSVIFQKIKSVLAVSLPTVFAFYFLGTIIDTSGEEAKRYFSPFKYVDTTYIMKHAGYEWKFVVAGLVIVVMAIAASYFIYTKKDIHSV